MSPEQKVSSAEMERMMKVQEVILKAMGRQPEMVGGSGDYRGVGSDHEAVAGALHKWHVGQFRVYG